MQKSSGMHHDSIGVQCSIGACLASNRFHGGPQTIYIIRNNNNKYNVYKIDRTWKIVIIIFI